MPSTVSLTADFADTTPLSLLYHDYRRLFRGPKCPNIPGKMANYDRILSESYNFKLARPELTSDVSKDIFRYMNRAIKSVRLTDPRALRAYAHPTRLALVGALRRGGPLTATQAGAIVGESPASCSFHLRQLAKYGLVEEVGGGRGRERPWRATALYTRLPRVADTPEQADASRLLLRVLAERYFEQLLRWITTRGAEPRRWQEAAHFGDDMLYLTADELAELKRRIDTLLAPYRPRTGKPARRPAGARRVTFLRLAFPGEDVRGRVPGAEHGKRHRR